MEQSEPDVKKNGGGNFVSSVYDVMYSAVCAIITVTVILTFVLRTVTVSGISMEPTLFDNDRLLLTNMTGNYKKGDIVVIYREGETPLIKRVIATGGDTVDIDFEQGTVRVNDEVLDEPYIAEPTHLMYFNGVDYPLTVPKGRLFCMGDNRNHSLDSRSADVGTIDEQWVVGKMIFNFSGMEGKK